MTHKLPIYEAKIRECDDTGIFAMSFVECPANESNFVALARHGHTVKLALDKHKQVLSGVVLIPGQLIYRNDPVRGEYYMKFTAADIEKIALKMMRTGIALSTTTHQHEKPLKGNYLSELWIVKDPKRDKTVALGLGEHPVGTLAASYKIGSADYWRTEVLPGNVKGFSLEGLFNFNNVTMSKQTKPAAQLAKERDAAKKGGKVSAFLHSMAAMLEGDTAAEADAVADEAKKDETGSGTPYLIFELSEGGEVWVDEDGFCTLDGEQMPAGEHALADGNFLVVDDTGMLVVTQPEANAEQPEEAAAALAKERGRKLLAKMGKQADPKEAKIAALKKQLAELEKQPSADKATPHVEGADTRKTVDADAPHHEKMAEVIRSRRERQDAKRKKQ